MATGSGYLMFAIPFAIIFFAILHFGAVEVVNEIIPVVNTFISDGSVTTQFVTYWDFLLDLIPASIFIFIVGLVAWLFVAAREEREETY